MPKICVVIPTYNEAGTIGELLDRLEALNLELEVVVVDDGSSDGTIEIVEMASRRYGNIILLERGAKRGLGSALRDGLRRGLELGAELLVTMDADLSHDPLELPKLVGEGGSHRIVLGSRYVEGGCIVGWGLYRRLVSWGANFLARLLAGVPSRDSTTGYRCYGAEVVRGVMPHVRGVGYEFQVEIIGVAQRMGFEIVEVPITFMDRRKGRSKLGFSEVLRYIWILLRLFHESGELDRALKFIAVGLSGLLINEAVIWLLTEVANIYYLISGAISAEVAIVNNFIWNNYWTFQDRGGGDLPGRFARFNLSRVLGIALGLLLLKLFTDILRLHYLISNALSVVIVFILNYLLSLFWVWRRPQGSRWIRIAHIG